MGQEIEFKLRARDERELTLVYEDLRSRFAAGGERVIRMHTRYFDTPDRLLRDRRWTLRIRQENAGISSFREGIFPLQISHCSDRIAFARHSTWTRRNSEGAYH